MYMLPNADCSDRSCTSALQYVYVCVMYICIKCRGGHAQLFLESAIAIVQLAGRTSAIAIPQLLKESCSATAAPQFRNRNFF